METDVDRHDRSGQYDARMSIEDGCRGLEDSVLLDIRLDGEVPNKLSSATLAAASGKSLTEVREKSLENGLGQTSQNEDIEKSFSVPEKSQPRFLRNLRYSLLSVYRKLFGVIFIANLVAFIYILAHYRGLDIPATHLATAASANLCAAIFVRLEIVINFIFFVCRAIPHSAPLAIRRVAAKGYAYGGVHSGCSISGTLWFLLLTIALTYQGVNGRLASDHIPIIAIAIFLLFILLLIIALAYPTLRMRNHNLFELSHRYLGWTAVGIFWIELGLIVRNSAIVNHVSLGSAFVQEPTTWFLIAITVSIFQSWIFLRKVEFEAENLSNHAIRLTFQGKLKPFRGVGLALTPLGQYHSFATYPAPERGENMHSILVSSAGDWTKKQASDPSNKRHFYLKGTYKAGVLAMATCFKKAIIVVTGSGIGPCLAFFNLPERLRVPCRILWVTRKEVYGDAILGQVMQCDPEAIIWDSKKSGRPDMLQLTWALYKRSDAEAVFMISNPNATRKLIYGLESRGVPAFGPIWDS